MEIRAYNDNDKQEGEIVATVMGGYEGHRGWINYLAVKPGQQRRGLVKGLSTIKV